jgi:hypothetical protein
MTEQVDNSSSIAPSTMSESPSRFELDNNSISMFSYCLMSASSEGPMVMQIDVLA